jgi:hypothetical protein
MLLGGSANDEEKANEKEIEAKETRNQKAHEEIARLARSDLN